MDRKLENLYDTKIAPLMAQISKICSENQMPMVAVFQYSDKKLAASIIAPDAFSNLIIDDEGLFRHETVNYVSHLVKLVQKTRQ